MNVFVFSGNLGNDAEQRYTPGGDSIVSFSVPCKSGYGEKAVTSWIKCSLWGKRGDSVLPYLKKGQLVGVSGEFMAREWTDKEGQKRISNEVRVNEVQLLGGRSDNAPQHQKQAPQQKRVAHGDGLDSDIPF